MKIEGAVLYLFYPSKTNPIENRHGWVILGKNSSTPKYVVCSTSYLLGHFLQINPNRLMVRKICLILVSSNMVTCFSHRFVARAP